MFIDIFHETLQRGYLTGFGGAAATTENTSPFFGGSLGFDVTRNLQITADFGRIQDVTAHFTREDLALVDQGVRAELGVPSSSTVEMPTNYLSGGMRFRFANDRKVQPYLLAHAGIAHMSPKPTFTAAGFDLTSEVLNADDQFVGHIFREETRPMATLGGGVTATLSRHVQVDVGYKYSGIFIKTDYLQDYNVSPHSHARIDTHRVYAGLGLTF